MMGEQSVMQEELFYGFSLQRHVPADHLVRAIDRFVDLSAIRQYLAPFYSPIGRPSIDPELLIRMLIVGYCFGIRSERRLCEEVHLNLAYRWFCRLGLEGEVPDHSTFSKNRHGRFREPICCANCSRPWSDAAWQKGSVGGEGFAVDASMIADASVSAGSKQLRSSSRGQAGRASPNTSPPWMMPPSGPPRRWSPSSSHLLIPPRAGLPLGVAQPSMPIARTI